MVNDVQLIGNVGQDVEVVIFDNSEKIAKFTLATSKSWTNKSSGERETKTVWHNIVCKGFNAEFAEKYLKKGSKIYIKGEIDNRSYNDKDGNKRYISEIVLDKYKGVLLSLDKKDTDNQSNTPSPSSDLLY